MFLEGKVSTWVKLAKSSQTQVDLDWSHLIQGQNIQ